MFRKKNTDTKNAAKAKSKALEAIKTLNAMSESEQVTKAIETINQAIGIIENIKNQLQEDAQAKKAEKEAKEKKEKKEAKEKEKKEKKEAKAKEKEEKKEDKNKKEPENNEAAKAKQALGKKALLKAQNDFIKDIQNIKDLKNIKNLYGSYTDHFKSYLNMSKKKSQTRDYIKTLQDKLNAVLDPIDKNATKLKVARGHFNGKEGDNPLNSKNINAQKQYEENSLIPLSEIDDLYGYLKNSQKLIKSKFASGHSKTVGQKFKEIQTELETLLYKLLIKR